MSSNFCVSFQGFGLHPPPPHPPTSRAVFPGPEQRFWARRKETAQPHHVCGAPAESSRPSALPITSPFSTTSDSNFLYSLFQNPDLTSPPSLWANDSTSYFVGKIEVTREKFPHSPATTLQTSLHSCCCSQIRRIADADGLIGLLQANPLTAAWRSRSPKSCSFHLFLFSCNLSGSPHSAEVFFLLVTKQSQDISIAPGTAGGVPHASGGLLGGGEGWAEYHGEGKYPGTNFQ